MSYIEIKNLSYGYKDNPLVLDNLNLTIEKGEFVCLLGHNGSGKSTIAKLLCGLLKAKKGEISIDDVVLSVDTVDEIRRKMGIVFQNPDNQFVGITVKDDIAFGLENRNMPKNEMLDLINKYADLVGMQAFLERNPETLSGGEKQRVAIAGILAYNPELIIFDEATSMIDPQGVNALLKTIQALKGQKTIIYITHNLNEALMADRIIVLKEGKVLLDDKKEMVLRQTAHLEAASLDTLLPIKLLNLIQDNNLKIGKEFEDLLWELV